jgi:hypothetical protein
MHDHVSQAREVKALDPGREAKTAINYLLFVISWGLLRIFVALWGPLAIRSAVRSAYRVYHRLREVTEISTGEVVQRRAGTQ